MVLCNCEDDPCRTEVYVSDVRIAIAERDRAVVECEQFNADGSPVWPQPRTRWQLLRGDRLIAEGWTTP